MQGRIVKGEAGQDPIRFGFSKDFDHCFCGVRIQIVGHEVNHSHVRIEHIDQVPQRFSEVFLCAMRCDQHMP